MVNFVDAFKAVQDGFAVRRSTWTNKFLYTHPVYDLMLLYNVGLGASTQPIREEHRYKFYADDFLADWEILPQQEITLMDYQFKTKGNK